MQGSQAKLPGADSQARLPRKRLPRGMLPGRGSQARFPSGSKKGSQETGSQARLPRQGFPARGSQARFPGTGFASTDFRNRFQGFQEPFPKQDFQEHAFASKTRFPE